MSKRRDQIMAWAHDGHFGDADVAAVLRELEELPNGRDWRVFIDRLLLWLGVTALGAGVIFFFAFNWDALGRVAKFALIEIPLAGCLLVIWRKGVDGIAGQATLLLAMLLTGALLALIGQTYQTGADPWQLFAWWAALTLPWALLGRLPALWLLWLLVVNTALALYLPHFSLFGGLFWGESQLLPHVALNLLALLAWEFGMDRGIPWMRAAWPARIIATAVGVMLTWLAMMAIINDSRHEPVNGLFWLLWFAGGLSYYLWLRRDLFMIAGALLSGIFVVTTGLARIMLDGRDIVGGLLLIGLVIIGLSTASAMWLRHLARQEDTP